MNIEIYRVTVDQMKVLISSDSESTLNVDEVEILAGTAKYSEPLLAAIYDNQLLGVFGFVPATLLSDEAHLWLYSTKAVNRHKMIFTRKSKEVIEQMLEIYPRIVGYCLTRSAMIWVQWLGGDFRHPINGAYPFEIRRV